MAENPYAPTVMTDTEKLSDLMRICEDKVLVGRAVVKEFYESHSSNILPETRKAYHEWMMKKMVL